MGKIVLTRSAPGVRRPVSTAVVRLDLEDGEGELLPGERGDEVLAEEAGGDLQRARREEVGGEQARGHAPRGRRRLA